jgi:hypothetical protein
MANGKVQYRGILAKIIERAFDSAIKVMRASDVCADGTFGLIDPG